MYRIGKTFRFEAAHYLLDSDSEPCHNLHGHSYKVEVVLAAPDLVKGMVWDFCHLSYWWEGMKASYDHALIIAPHCLGDALTGAVVANGGKVIAVAGEPTAENMAKEFHDRLRQFLAAEKRAGVKVESVKVWETESAWAEYRP